MAQQTLDGMEAGTRLTIVGTALDCDDEFVLGDHVAITIKGHVVMAGVESLEKTGVRRVVKVRADIIEVES